MEPISTATGTTEDPDATATPAPTGGAHAATGTNGDANATPAPSGDAGATPATTGGADAEPVVETPIAQNALVALKPPNGAKAANDADNWHWLAEGEEEEPKEKDACEDPDE